MMGAGNEGPGRGRAGGMGIGTGGHTNGAARARRDA